MLRKLLDFLYRIIPARFRHRPESPYNFVEFPTGPEPSLPGAYMGQDYPLQVESTTIVATGRKLNGDWTIEIGTGWPIYKEIPGLPEVQQLDDRRWPRGGDGEPTRHVPLRGHDDLLPGTRVIWKGNVFDYVWDFGVIVERGGELYVESPSCPDHWSSPVYDHKQGCWVTRGACYTPYPLSLGPPSDNKQRQGQQ